MTMERWRAEGVTVWCGDRVIAVAATQRDKSEEERNAKLMAAAPSLLSALDELIEASEHSRDDFRLCDAWRVALTVIREAR